MGKSPVALYQVIEVTKVLGHLTQSIFLLNFIIPFPRMNTLEIIFKEKYKNKPITKIKIFSSNIIKIYPVL